MAGHCPGGAAEEASDAATAVRTDDEESRRVASGSSYERIKWVTVDEFHFDVLFREPGSRTSLGERGVRFLAVSWGTGVHEHELGADRAGDRSGLCHGAEGGG